MKIIELDPMQFEEFLLTRPDSTPWQTPQYGNVMSNFGYSVKYIGFEEEGKLVGASLLLSVDIYLGFKHFYAPRGILTDYNDIRTLSNIIKELKKYIFKQKGLVYTLDPTIVKSERDRKGNPILYYDNFENLVNVFKENEVEYQGETLYFEGIQPRWYATMKLPIKPEKLFKRLEKQARNKLRKAAKFGVEIYQDETTNIEQLFKIHQDFTKRPIGYYQELKNNFGSNFEIYYAKINTEKYVHNSKILYEKEIEKSDFLNSIIQNNSYKGKNMRAILNKKMETDKVLSSYKNHLIRSTQLLKDYPDGIIIGACIVLRHKMDIYIYEESYSKELNNLCPLYLLRWKILEKYSAIASSINLGPITGNFNKKENKLYGLNETKLSFGCKATEYIGEFSQVVNKPLFSLYNNNRKDITI